MTREEYKIKLWEELHAADERGELDEAFETLSPEEFEIAFSSREEDLIASIQSQISR